MKHNYLWIFSILFIFLSCSEEEEKTDLAFDPPSPPEPVNDDDGDIYTLNLTSNSNTELESVTISWDAQQGEIVITDVSGAPANCVQSNNSCIFSGLNPGEYKEILFELAVDNDGDETDSTYEDRIQIYTRAVQPITNFNYEIKTRMDLDHIRDENENFHDKNKAATGNGTWTEGEYFTELFTDSNDGIWNPWEDYNDGNIGTWDFKDQNGNGICDYTGTFASGFTSSECETFKDGNDQYDFGEAFIDVVDNDNWDFHDQDGDQICDYTGTFESGFTSSECEPFEDGNGQYDLGEAYIDCSISDPSICEGDPAWIDGIGSNDWTSGETWTDEKNGICDEDEGELYTEKKNGIWDFNETWTDEKNGIWNGNELYTNSNDNSWQHWEDYNDGNIGTWDFKDQNGNGICDYSGTFESGFTSSECEPFTDGDGQWDFSDLDDDHICDYTGSFALGTFASTECEPFQDVLEPYYDRELNWTASTESAFSKYYIYRVILDNAESLIIPENCIDCLIDSIAVQSVISYTDSSGILFSSSGTFIEYAGTDSFYYLVQVSTGEYTRNSFIHYNAFDKPSITLTTNDVSKEFKEYVRIQWAISESNYFYEYKIERYQDNLGETIERTISIPDREVDHFFDREVADTYPNTTKFYRIAVVYLDGTHNYNSGYIEGNSIP